jgi:hypothetical protein
MRTGAFDGGVVTEVEEEDLYAAVTLLADAALFEYCSHP